MTCVSLTRRFLKNAESNLVDILSVEIELSFSRTIESLKSGDVDLGTCDYPKESETRSGAKARMRGFMLLPCRFFRAL